MKRTILLLLLLILLPKLSFASSDITYIDVKVGKTYDIFERLDISSSEGLALYPKNDLDSEILIFDNYKVYVGKTFGLNDKLDIYNEEGQYITSIPANGGVLIGPYPGSLSTIRVGQKEYRGYVGFVEDASGMKVINHINIEDYLFGVVPREIPSLSPPEALKAQAVAARSYAYSSLNKHSKENYNLCDTTHCQVYGGFLDEKPTTNDAILQTKDIVVKHQGGVANTVFHSTSGGFTESSENIWGSRLSYLVGKSDPYSLNSKNATWEFEVDKDLLYSRLNENGYQIYKLNNIKIMETYASGRVKSLLINEGEENLTISGERFRSLIGTNDLKSTLFTINGLEIKNTSKDIYAIDKNQISKVKDISILFDKSSTSYKEISSISVIGKDNKITKLLPSNISSDIDRIIISGKGYGHGVGMSQYGAIDMAKQGFTYIDILSFYYSNVEVTKIN